MDTLRVFPDEWNQVAVAARSKSGNDKLPDWNAMANYYSVCIPSIVTMLSFTLWNLHQRIRGTKNETYQSYYDLPAFWVDACGIMDAEIARIDKIRDDKSQREQREFARRVGNK